MTAAQHLRARADSYAHDAFILHNDGDTAMAAAYRAIADELRKTADTINTVVWGSDCLDCGNATNASQRCDLCGSDTRTIPLYYDQHADERRPAEA